MDSSNNCTWDQVSPLSNIGKEPLKKPFFILASISTPVNVSIEFTVPTVTADTPAHTMSSPAWQN